MPFLSRLARSYTFLYEPGPAHPQRRTHPHRSISRTHSSFRDAEDAFYGLILGHCRSNPSRTWRPVSIAEGSGALAQAVITERIGGYRVWTCYLYRDSELPPEPWAPSSPVSVHQTRSHLDLAVIYANSRWCDG